jgi:hypothetical protein
VRKPNYRFERAERDRTRQAKKEAKARRQEERVSQEKSDEIGQPMSPPTTKTGDDGGG